MPNEEKIEKWLSMACKNSISDLQAKPSCYRTTILNYAMIPLPPHQILEKRKQVRWKKKEALLNLASTASPQEHITYLSNKNSSAAERVLHLLYNTHYSIKCIANMNRTE